MIDQLPGYQHWVSESFLLLADSYSARGDNFQARLTLQNIIDNYSDQEIVQRARDKKEELLKAEIRDILEIPDRNNEDLIIEFEPTRSNHIQLFEVDTLRDQEEELDLLDDQAPIIEQPENIEE